MEDDFRIKQLNDRTVKHGKYVLYWMQQSQRAQQNPALSFAIEQANRLSQPLIAGFGLTADYPEANARHYTFMLEGLKECRRTLADRKIKMVIQEGSPDHVALNMCRSASLIVCDAGYLMHQKAWRKNVAEQSEAPVIQVESDVVVPVAVTSNKAEYAARFIRPKIHRQLDGYLKPCAEPDLRISSLDMDWPEMDIENISQTIDQLKTDKQVFPVSRFFKGGTSQAIRRLNAFIEDGLTRYETNGNQPQTDDISHLSPYLHFGQISPVYVADRIKAMETGSPSAADAFLEQLIIRRELSVNFVNYSKYYDRFDVLPAWARKTLKEHANDPREYIYDVDALVNAQTHDPYWNAAMLEMVHTGFMHNYMRMYWGKKVLEWSPSPEKAFETLIHLNNRYFLDGRDPNSYAGVLWIFGLHDRAWKERPVFGKVRYMNAAGLERKSDIKAYVEKIGKYRLL